MAYFDNVLIYNIKKKDHASHLLQMLRQLHKQGLQIDIDQCKFLIIKVKYLSMIVTIDSVEMDTEKTKAIQYWEASGIVKEVQAFFGFANFYHQFIPSFLKVF